MDALLGSTIVKLNIKASRHRNNELMQSLMCMASSLGTARNVIQVVDPANIERNMVAALDKGQIAARVLNLGKIDDPAEINAIHAPLPR